MIRALAAAALLPLVAASSDPLAGRVAGKPEQCLDTSRTTGPDIVDEHNILYRDGAKLYRTSIEACPSLRPFSTLIVEVFGGQTCRGDRFRVLTPNTSIPSSYCRFGTFTPYTKVKGRTG